MTTKLLVGTSDGLHEVGDVRPARLRGHEVGSIAAGDSGWWAIVDGKEIWRSQNGDSWSPIASNDDLTLNCLLSTKSGLLVGTSEAHLCTVQGESIVAVNAFDHTEARSTWYTPWGGPPDVRSLSAAPSGAIYANVHVGGVVRSGDGGITWQPTIDIDADVHEVLADRDSGLVLAASARGLAVSGDDGGTWRYDTEGLHGRYLRAVAVAGDNVLVTASTGPFTDHAAVYRHPVVGGTVFQRCTAGLPESFPDNVDTSCLAAEGATAAFGTADGRVFLSSDAGETWSQIAQDLPRVNCVVLQ